MQRRDFLSLALAACAGPAMAQGGPQPSDLLGASGDPTFLTWLNGFYARSLAAGWPRAVLDKELSGLSPDPQVVVHDATQPEFARPISIYVQNAIGAGTVALGRQKRAGVPQLHRIAETYGVPGDVLVAIWGMESGFGGGQGNFDVVRSFATLAAETPRRQAWAEDELNACLKIITSGAATRSQLKGSWAGAMGQTQFLPTTFLTTAVDADGDGKPDIWNSSADALASAANLLVKGGWQRGQGWAREVLLAHRFDYSLCEGPKEIPAWWADKGVTRADGQGWGPGDAAAQAALVLPCGASGPAFLIFPNHFAIRTYNNSLAYALSVGLLADRLGDGPALVTPWPHETPLSLADRVAAQTALAKLGFNPGPVDGAVGLGTRQALRSWQKSQDILADGYLSPDMVARLKAAAPAT
jgi:lytic murein transglycosylase